MKHAAIDATLADEWGRYRDIMVQHGYPAEIVADTFEGLFYAGATATLALLASQADPRAIQRELEAYAALHFTRLAS